MHRSPIPDEKKSPRHFHAPKWLAVGSLLLFTLALMLPRLLSAQFGLFDDPTADTVAHRLLAGNFHWNEDPTAARYRPLYWLYYAALYGVFGRQAAWFYVGNTLLLGWLVVSVYWLARRAGAARLQAWLAAVLLLLAGPVVENFYTLSKPEMLQSAWLGLFWLSGSQALNRLSRRRQVFQFLLCTLWALLACLTKETGVLLAGVSLGWLILAWLLERWKVPLAFPTRQRLCLFLAALLGSVLFLLLRSFSYDFSMLSQGYGAHFDFSPGFLLDRIAAWKEWLLRDYLYLLPLLPLPFLSLLGKRSPSHIQLSLEALAWMGVWFAVYLPWMFTGEYYLLPFACGAALLSANLVADGWQALRSSGWLSRGSAAGLLALSAFLFALTLPNNYSNAGLQLVTDASNAALLHALAADLPPRSLALLNIQEPNEYVVQAQIQITEVEGRPDLQIEPFQFQELTKAGGRDVYVVMARIENQFFPSVRTGISEGAAEAWNQSLVEHFGDPGELVFETNHRFKYLTVKNTWLLCPLARYFGYCEYIKSAFQQEVFVYGWQVYRLTP